MATAMTKKLSATAWICVGPSPRTGKLVIQENAMAARKRDATGAMETALLDWSDFRRLGFRCVRATVSFVLPKTKGVVKK